jgi:hypothetical protein
LGVQFSHWRIVGGEIETIPLYIYRECKEDEIRPWMKSIQPRNMLRVKVQFTRSIVPEQRRAKIIELIGKDRSDTELRAAAKDRRPAKIADPYFKTLTLDRSADCYRTKVKWRTKAVDLCFDLDNEKKLTTLCRKAEAFWRTAKEQDGHTRATAVRDLLELKNDSWLEQGERKVTPRQFASRLKLTSVVVSKNGAFEFVFDDGDLFMGHDVVVHGTFSAGPKRADIGG